MVTHGSGSMVSKSGHTDMLELFRLRELQAVDDQECGQIDAGVLVGLNLETFPVPVNGVLKTVRIRVIGFHKLVLVDSATETD